jgi:hypothetical protein
MKRIFLSFSFSIIALLALAQEPVSWQFEYVSDGADEGKLVLRATMKDNWVIYSQHTAEGGPLPTIFDFHDSPDYTFKGDVKEISHAVKDFDEMFEIETIKFKNEAVFEQQLINVNPNSIFLGSVTFMACNNQQCLPPKELRFEVKT